MLATITAARFGDREVGMASKEMTDKLGSVASALCALHCAVCAFLPVIFTGLGLGFLLGQSVEWLFSIVAVVFGLGALVLGWRTHGSKKVAALLTVGVIGILVSRGMEMGSDHHGHGHGDEHGDDHDDEHGDEHGDDHDDDHDDEHGDDHDDASHMLGAIVGVLAGMTLLSGHLLNIQAARRCREEDCA